MAFQFSVTLRNDRVAELNAAVGASAVLKMFSGAEPANCAASDPSGLLITITLPSSPWSSASSGAVTLNGTWSGTASASGTAACFRIYDGSSNCHLQGNITATGGGGDMTLDNTSISNTQTVSVTTFTVTDGNA